MVVEVMGRHAGWITLMSAVAGGAHFILIPEEEVEMEELCQRVKEYHRRRGYCIVAVAEGVRMRGSKEVLQDTELDEFGHVRLGGVGKAFERIIQKNTGLEVRSVILGHLQRGGAPTPFDRVLGTRLGIKAIDMVKERRFGYMATYLDGQIKEVPIKDAVSELKLVPAPLYQSLKKVGEE
jgi:6-phosphofructokinase 1